MVCLCCKRIVRDELEKLGIHPLRMEFGHIDVSEKVTDIKREQIRLALLVFDLELVDDKRSMLIEKIKNVINEFVRSLAEQKKLRFSDYLAQSLHLDYTYLANVFSHVSGVTIEKYLIGQKISRVKELLADNELNMNEIADLLHYTSVSHLSTQFKKITGFTPSHFRTFEYPRLPVSA